jgi:hypothetical protein
MTKMKTSVFTSEFLIYRIRTEENLYIAVPQAFVRIVRQYATEYQCLRLVPAEVKVKGVLFRDPRSRYSGVETAQQLTDMPVNQLEFYSGGSVF